MATIRRAPLMRRHFYSPTLIPWPTRTLLVMAWASALASLIFGVYDHSPRGFVIVISSFVAALGLSAYNLLRPTDSADKEVRKILAVFGHLATTWGIAGCWGAFWYDPSDSSKAWGQAITVTIAVGGMLSLFRSTSTGMSSEAAAYEVARLSRLLEARSDLFSMAMGIRGTPDDIVYLNLMLKHAKKLLPEHLQFVNGLSLWIRGPRVWKILAHDGLTQGTAEAFEQEVLTEGQAGAGVIANLEVSGRRSVIIASRVDQHDWYKPDQDRAAPTAGLAAILIYRRHEIAGALCLTSSTPEVIPQEGSGGRPEFEDMLHNWASAFTLALDRTGGLHGPPN